MSKVLVVGDVHAEFNKLNTLINDKQPSVVLQCGDLGWWPRIDGMDMHRDGSSWNLRGIKAQDSQVYFCDGNHEDHDALRDMQLAGEPTELYKGVTFCPRGSTITLPDGRVVLFYGGANSVDKEWRTEGFDWFREEIPNGTEFRRAGQHDHIDIIISHTCPLEFSVVGHIAGKEDDPTRNDLSMLLAKYQPKEWYFGHWHTVRSGQYGNTRWQALNHISSGSLSWVSV